MTIEDLSARLETVERQNRRMRAVGIATMVLMAAGVAMGQATPSPKVIEAQAFVLRDSAGVELGRLECSGAEEFSWGRLTLLGPNSGGEVEVRGGLAPRLRIKETRGPDHSVANLSTWGLRVTLGRDARREWQGSLSAMGFTFKGRQHGDVEKLRKRLEAENIAKKAGYSAAIIESTAEQESWRKVCEFESGELLEEPPIPGLSIFDSAGVTRASLGSTTLISPKGDTQELLPPSSLVLFDKDGKVIERLPK